MLRLLFLRPVDLAICYIAFIREAECRFLK